MSDATARVLDPYANVPAALKAERRWVVWKREPHKTKPGQWTKVPYQAKEPARKAASTRSEEWTSFEEATNAVARCAELSGIGFMLGDGWCGVDCDHCIDGGSGRPKEWATRIICDLASYSEYSPSGEGVHIIVRGELPDGWRKQGNLEMYSADRYFTVTGKMVPGSPSTIEDRTEALRDLHARYTKRVERPDVRVLPTRVSASADDSALLDRACNAKNGAQFARLRAGDWKGAGYSSQSEADLAYCSHLLYWTDGDTARSDRLFRESGLFRSKWDEKHGAQTYGEQTIAKALVGVRHHSPMLFLSESDKNRVENRDGGDSLPLPVCAADVGEPEPVEWLVEDLWTAGELGIWFGDGGSFKSSLALHVALAVAGGRKVFDRFATTKRPVLILSEEDGQSVIKARLDAIRRGHGWHEDVLRNLYILAMNEASLADGQWIAHLHRFIEEHDIGLLLCDPLCDLIKGNENDSSEQRPTIKNTRRLTRQGRTTVQIVHHAAKKRAETRTLDRLRGTSAWNQASRAIYFVELVEDEMTVECLKLSRAARPATFSVRRIIDTDPANKAMWRTARFEYATVAEVSLNRAEEFILDQLEAGERLTTTELKKAASSTKIRMADLSRAIKTLSMRGRIDFEDGDRGSKKWGIRDLAVKNSPQGGQGQNSTLPTLPQLAYRKVNTVRDLARPYKGQGALVRGGQGDLVDRGEAWEPEPEDAA